MEGDHESNDTKISTRPEYTSYQKIVSKNTYPFGRCSDDILGKLNDQKMLAALMNSIKNKNFFSQ